MIVAHIRANFAKAFFPRWAEWSAAGVILALGWMLSNNDVLMQNAIDAGNGRGYALLLAIASQGTWAFVMTVFGLLRLIVLLINGAWRRSPYARAAAAFLSSFFWTQITLSFAPTFGFAFILSAGWLVTDIVNIARAMRDARTIDEGLAREKGIGLE